MKYKCKKCNKMILRQRGQWRSNYARFRNARICGECFVKLYEISNHAKFKLKYYRNIIYPNYKDKWVRK